MLERLRSAIYGTRDLGRSKRFYAELLGKAPYFDEPFYVGFDVNGCELGLDPDGAVSTSPVYWRVASLETTLEKATALGATRVGETREVGGGITMAVVDDPSGNQVRLIEEKA